MRLELAATSSLILTLAIGSPVVAFQCSDYRWTAYPDGEDFCGIRIEETDDYIPKYAPGNWTDAGGERHVKNLDELRSAICTHREGDQTTVVIDANIDLTGETDIRLRPGLTLKGTRSGIDRGHSLYTTDPWTRRLFRIRKGGVHIANLRFRGPSGSKNIIRPPLPRVSDFRGNRAGPAYFAALSEWRECHARANAFWVDGTAFVSGLVTTIEDSEFYWWTGAGVEVRGLRGQIAYDPRELDPELFVYCLPWFPYNHITCRTSHVVGPDDADRVVISRNYFHTNRQQGSGYGTIISNGGYALIEKNTFFDNRHAIAADGNFGTGYFAHSNLILPSDTRYCESRWGVQGCWYEHHFDMHGRAPDGGGVGGAGNYEGGIGGDYVEIAHNTILGDQQHRLARWAKRVLGWVWGGLETKGVRAAYHLRGIPEQKTRIFGNVFEHKTHNHGLRFISVLEDPPPGYPRWIKIRRDLPLSDGMDWFDNIWNYQQPADADITGTTDDGSLLDFDGDGVGDGLWATGAGWYYKSGFGGPDETEWRFLNRCGYMLDELELVDEDGNGLTDVVRHSPAGFDTIAWDGAGSCTTPFERPSPVCADVELFELCGDPGTDAFCRPTTEGVAMCVTSFGVHPTPCSSRTECEWLQGGRCVLNLEAEKGDPPGICQRLYFPID